ncbi:MAG TPA: hypothetical protein VI653_28455 [Steroidobacteraceae bacterium]
MNPILTTVITSALSTIVFPWLEQAIGLKLDPTQQVAWTASTVGAATGVAHWAHAKFFTTQAATVTSVAKSFLPLAFLIGMLMAATSLVGLSGCAQLSKLGTPAAQPYVSDAVDAAVLGAEIAGVPAAEINRISKLALAADQGAAATVATVAGVINDELAKLKLTDPELTSVHVLEGKLAAALQAQIDKNPNAATAQAVVADMLNEAIKITGG